MLQYEEKILKASLTAVAEELEDMAGFMRYFLDDSKAVEDFKTFTYNLSNLAYYLTENLTELVEQRCEDSLDNS